jgi:trehalose 6-phosphate phosphatase
VLPTVLDPLVRAAPRSAVLVDFDGSLAPIVDDPAAAVILPAARAALGALAPVVGLLAIVSGRPVDFLREQVDVPNVVHVGQYGLERVVEGRVVVDPRAEPFVPEVARLALAAARDLPAAHVERKGRIALGLHWRAHPEAAAEVQAWAEAAGRIGGLECTRGRMAVELRPPLDVDKGGAVEELVRGMHAAAFAGDDRGDLPAFAALDRMRADGRLAAAVKIGVRSVEEPPEIVAASDLHVDGPAGLAALLGALGAAIRSALRPEPG